MVRDAEYEAAMTEPEALARGEEPVADRVRMEFASLDAFVRTHYPRLIRLAGLITRNADQAQDAVQAGLERAWRKRNNIRDPAKLRPWLDRIVAREAIRQTSGGGLSAVRQRESGDWVEYPSTLPEPAELVILREAVGRLSSNHRAVIALHLHEGYTVEETARVLDVPFDTVRSRLRAARERLRHELTEKDQ
jgi:RNA polymerase sigma-70 factor (ECF subfamily)